MTRSNLYDIITKRIFDAQREFNRIHSLFHDKNYVRYNGDSLYDLVRMSFYAFPIQFRGRSLSFFDFNYTHGFDFDDPDIEITNDTLITYCEYIVTLCDHLIEYAPEIIDKDNQYVLKDMYATITDCMDELGLEGIKKNNITIYVEKDPTVVAAAKLMDESLSYDVRSYIHNRTKGDLTKKKTILKYLADEIELKRTTLNGINKTLSGNLFQMFQKFVRHNNEDNVYIKSLSPEALEACYDDIYQMWLLATLELDNIERMQRVKKILGEINAPST